MATFYNNPNVKNSGWKFVFNSELSVELQAEVNNQWVSVFRFDHDNNKLRTDALETNTFYPTVIVVDNFYKNPDEMRKFALTQTFNLHPTSHKGRRTEECFRFNLKEKFEQIMGYKIINWDKYGMNGRFQYCIGGDQLVYHTDLQEYAALIFLSPDAPPETGTTFYRSKYTKTMKLNNKEEYSTVFRNGHLDSTDFELVDVVGNVYNRLVIFDGKLLHAASNYFGTDVNNGRLFHIFFFDIERN